MVVKFFLFVLWVCFGCIFRDNLQHQAGHPRGPVLFVIACVRYLACSHVGFGLMLSLFCVMC